MEALEGGTQVVEDSTSEPERSPAGSEAPLVSEECLCVICRMPMLVSEEREALPCMHVFHKHCIEAYANCKGSPVAQCCPCKCNVTHAQVVMDLGDSPPEHEQQLVAERLGRSVEEVRDLVPVALDEADALARAVE